MNELLNTNKELIYEVRGKKVILDRDLAKILNVETKVLNQTIKRNIDLFSDDDYFKLNSEEFFNLKSQIVTLSWGGSRTLPYALTGNGLKIFLEISKSKNKPNNILNILDLFDNSDKTDVIFIPNKDIEKCIYIVREKQVMLDYDLSEIYKCKNGTKEINQAVKNNPDKFPERFLWVLTEEEFANLRSKILTSSLDKNNYGGRRYLPRVFTEQGVMMLATILKTPVATDASIAIMDAFVTMRKYFSTNTISNNFIMDDHHLLMHLNKESIKHNDETDNLFDFNTPITKYISLYDGCGEGGGAN